MGFKKFIPSAHINKKYNRLLILEEVLPPIRSKDRALMLCDCGKKKIISMWEVVTGSIKSCGCLQKENHVKTHSMSRTKEYRAWLGMKARCYNKKNVNYKFYGARGVQIDETWRKSFEEFFKHVGISPSPKHSLDRIDNNSGYFPGNVRWSLREAQDNNRRDTHLITYSGKTQSITLWAKELGIKRSTIFGRLESGWSEHDAILAPLRLPPKTITFNGKTKTLREWGKEAGISHQALAARLRLGWTIETALTDPVSPLSRKRPVISSKSYPQLAQT